MTERENVVRRHPGRDPLKPDSRIMRCSFTGYRPQKMPFWFDEKNPLCLDFKARLKETIRMLISEGYAHFLSGGALGMDMFAAEAVLELREEYPHIALEMVIPFDDQPVRWEERFRERYEKLLDDADIITFTGHSYTKGSMFARNRYLVNNADLLLAAYDGQPGGTAMTVQYAKEMDIRVLRIPPVTEKKKSCRTA